MELTSFEKREYSAKIYNRVDRYIFGSDYSRIPAEVDALYYPILNKARKQWGDHVIVYGDFIVDEIPNMSNDYYELKRIYLDFFLNILICVKHLKKFNFYLYGHKLIR